MASDSDNFDWLYRRDPGRGGDGPAEETRAMSADEMAGLRGEPSRRSSHPEDHPPRQHHREEYQREEYRPQPVRPVAPPPPPGTPSRSRRRRRRRGPVRRFFTTAGVLLVALVVWLVGVPAYAWTVGNDVEAFPTGERPGHQLGRLYLLVGSDSRAGLTEEERSEFGTGSTEGQRADTLMLMHVPLLGSPTLISIPRDSYVAIPGYGENKINAAYAFGGAPLLVETLEASTGLRVDNYVEVGFGGFVSVVDAVGGVELCPETAISDARAHLDVEAGCQEMDGATALGYARTRYEDPRADLGRVERQREVMSAVAEEAVSPVTVLNPVRYWRLNQAAAGSTSTDSGTGVLDAAQLAVAMARVSAGQGSTLTVPVSNPDAQTPAGSAVLWDDTLAPELFDAVARSDGDDIARVAAEQ